MVEIIVKEMPERPKPGEKIELPNGEHVRVRHIGIPWLLPPKKICNDPECPWHGHLSIRGQIFEVTVESVHGRSAVVVHEWLHYNPKYKRYERRRKKMHVRVPPCIDVNPGDKVYISEARPLAKTIRHVVIGKPEDVTEAKPQVFKLEQ
ncbi:MAG: 30S ribosomal protein S17 [Vulcanisaeta sp. AZ3]|jgi:small subunit ribosomal protein S17